MKIRFNELANHPMLYSAVDQIKKAIVAACLAFTLFIIGLKREMSKLSELWRNKTIWVPSAVKYSWFVIFHHGW